MTTTREHRPRQATRGVLRGVAVLGATLAGAVVAALACGHDGPRWAEAVAFAATVAGISGIGGWLAAHRPAPNPASAVAAALGATALRIIPPLAALAWLADRGAPLREAGAGGLVVVFYLLLLATAILLHIMVAPERQARRSDGPR